MATVGFPADLAPMLAMLMLLCAVVYAYPPTSVLGAILVTGFFGVAICLHLRIGEIGSPPRLVCLAIGLMAWAGLFLRDANVRAVLPVRRRAQRWLGRAVAHEQSLQDCA